MSLIFNTLFGHNDFYYAVVFLAGIILFSRQLLQKDDRPVEFRTDKDIRDTRRIFWLLGLLLMAGLLLRLVLKHSGDIGAFFAGG